MTLPNMYIDVETYSELDLKKVGAYVYASHPSTKVLVVSYQTDILPRPARWYPTIDPLPPHILMHAKFQPVAHNADFERLIFRDTLFCDLGDNWRCTMIEASQSGYPLGLDALSQAMDLPFGKDQNGRKIMLKMCKPRRGNPTPYHISNPEMLARLGDYCDCDVMLTKAIANDPRILPLSPKEKLAREVDLKMNDRGLPIDLDRVRKFKQISDDLIADLDAKINTASNGVVPNTRAAQKLLNAVRLHPGMKNVKSLNKEKLPKVIAEAYRLGYPKLVEILSIRQEAAVTSVAKLNAMIAGTTGQQPGFGRCRGVFQFNGASRTGRYAGRLIQPQNFPRPLYDNKQLEIEIGLCEAGLECWTLSLISSALRSCIALPPCLGRKQVVLDFAQIEARVLAWLAQHQTLLAEFSAGRDVYQFTGDRVARTVRRSNIPTGSKLARALGKVLVLACGYQMGADKFHETCAKAPYFLQFTRDEARTLLSTWRKDNSPIPALWRAAESVWIKAIHYPDHRHSLHPGKAHAVNFQYDTDIDAMIVTLPGDRELVYREPQGLSYMGTNQYTRKWERIDTYGGKIVENITQAVARDLLVSMMRVTENIGDLTGTVHDEVILEADEHHALKILLYFKDENVLRAQLGLHGSSVAKAMPLQADGFVDYRYGK